MAKGTRKKASRIIQQDYAFYEQLWYFYYQNRGKVLRRYKDLTRKFLAFNNKSENPDAYLREPQFHALEMYVFIKEFMGNKHMYEMFDDWRHHKNDFSDSSFYGIRHDGQMFLFDDTDVQEQNNEIFRQMEHYKEEYPNYIYSLAMGLGKTTLIATCIFYEFLLANKYPTDTRFCHNALVFAPDKTVLDALHEIMDLIQENNGEKQVVPPEYRGVLYGKIHFHFLDETSTPLQTIDDSSFNIIISNTQKIILKQKHKEDTPTDQLFLGDGLLSTVTLPETMNAIADNAFYNCPNLSSVTILNSDCYIGDDTVFSSNENGEYHGVIRGYEGSTAYEYAVIHDIPFISLGEDPSKVTTTTTTSTTTTTTTTSTTTTTTSTTSTTTTTTTTSTTTTSSSKPDNIIATGVCGDNVAWSLDYNGKLIISGKGDMYDMYNIYDYGVPDIVKCPWYDNYRDITEVVIENGVTSIGMAAFSGCESLISITIPKSVTSIGNAAFGECYRLTSITIPDNVTSIGISAFKRCSNLTSIIIPDSVTSIGKATFSDCSSLTFITIPDSITSIGDSAFCGCNSLTSVNIPNSITSIGDSAFCGCNRLTSITIPDNVTSIGLQAFWGCSSMTSIIIPDSVTSIGSIAFDSCDKLTIVCNAGSYAEKYAKNNHIPYKEYKISLLPGDVNNDGSMNIADVVSLQNFLLGRTKTLENWKNADLCEDNRLNGFDMILMRRLLIEKMQS